MDFSGFQGISGELKGVLGSFRNVEGFEEI